jgi:predicted O-linked N-acetylglucosamine transferase (SPINDLY family)
MDMIYQDSIDILIDMQGHMRNNFNHGLMLKPAPIQIHWLGYPGTLGMSCIDYLIADRIVLPETSQHYYREKILYLDPCYQVNNSKLLVESSCFTRTQLGLPEGIFLFTHFNDNYKLEKQTWKIWMEILRRVPNSALVLIVGDRSLRDMLEADARSCGVDVSRLLYVEWLSRQAHINRLALTDCGLDTHLCNGHTTSSDLLSAGRPVITFPGATYQSRVTKSLLSAVALEELVCDSWEAYIQKAVQLATCSNYYHSVVRAILQNREKILFNAKLYAETFVASLCDVVKN